MPLLVALGAYLIGSIPFSYFIAKRWGISDVRKVGSGNVGATNVMRSAGILPGLLAFALDVAKGALATAAAGRLDPPEVMAGSAALCVVVGHVFPIWLGFRGGKGVATGVGAFVPVCPVAALGAVLVFALGLGATRYVSVGSIAGTLSLVVLLVVFQVPRPAIFAATLAAALILFRHRENVARLIQGKERRTGSART